MNGAAGDPQRGPWARLDALLQTDPQDVGCDAALEVLDVYAEMLAAGNDAAGRFPGRHAHLSACGPCAEDLAGLLVALTGHARWAGRDLTQ